MDLVASTQAKIMEQINLLSVTGQLPAIATPATGRQSQGYGKGATLQTTKESKLRQDPSLQVKATPDLSRPTTDTVSLSKEGLEHAENAQKNDQKGDANQNLPKNPSELSAQELIELSKLKQRDREVRAHEQAHLFVAGAHARGGASFTYTKGPDGKSYAIGGTVSIDVSEEMTPEATIAKMQTVRRAALAPRNPSAADRRVAMQATMKEARARQELQQDFQEELSQIYEKDREDDLLSGNPQDLISITAPAYESLAEKLAVYQRMAKQSDSL